MKLKSIGFGRRSRGRLWRVRRFIGALAYIAATLWAWFHTGGRIRREYRRHLAEGRMYHVDRMFDQPRRD